MNLDDTATELEETFRDLALRERETNASKHKIQPTGACRCCGDEEIPEGALFCCRECRDDYDHMLKAKRISGAW